MNGNKFTNYETMKVISSYRIFKTVYHNHSYLLLFTKENYEVLKLDANGSSYF